MRIRNKKDSIPVISIRLDPKYLAALEIIRENFVKEWLQTPNNSQLIRLALDEYIEKHKISQEQLKLKLRELHEKNQEQYGELIPGLNIAEKGTLE